MLNNESKLSASAYDWLEFAKEDDGKSQNDDKYHFELYNLLT